MHYFIFFLKIGSALTAAFSAYFWIKAAKIDMPPPSMFLSNSGSDVTAAFKLRAEQSKHNGSAAIFAAISALLQSILIFIS